MILIFANILIGAISGIYWFTVYDKYLEKEFKQEYSQWKNKTPEVMDDLTDLREEDRIMQLDDVQ